LGCDDGFFLKAGKSSDEQSVRESTITLNAIDAIENFASAHSETIEEIINWPWKKFEAFYESYSKREQVKSANAERRAYITGLLANPNLDDGKQTRRTILNNVDIDFENAIKSIYNVVIGEEFDSDQDPFFKAMKVPGMEQATDNDRTTENLEETNQGG